MRMGEFMREGLSITHGTRPKALAPIGNLKPNLKPNLQLHLKPNLLQIVPSPKVLTMDLFL